VASYKIEGMDRLEKTIKKLGKLPQKCVSTAARKGILIAKRAAKKGGWVDQTGYLRKGIVQKAERTKTQGKKVYQVSMDANMNDVFVKITKEGKRYYYPSSQEYGFKTRNGGYTPGFHFMRDALEDNKSKIEKEIFDVLSKEIDKL
jgi:HK97 gp10 family phage protein